MNRKKENKKQSYTVFARSGERQRMCWSWWGEGRKEGKGVLFGGGGGRGGGGVSEERGKE